MSVVAAQALVMLICWQVAPFMSSAKASQAVWGKAVKLNDWLTAQVADQTCSWHPKPEAGDKSLPSMCWLSH